MRRMLLALALALPIGAWAAEARPPVAGVYGGFGVDTWSQGSGSLMADYRVWYGKKWYEKARLHVQLWTDAEERPQSETVTTTTTQYTRPITTVTSTTIIDNTRGTSNVAVGIAWCPTYLALFACAGVAYLADDNTRNINNHWQGNFAAGFELKGWTIFAQNYMDSDDIGYEEWFVMAGKSFSIK